MPTQPVSEAERKRRSDRIKEVKPWTYPKKWTVDGKMRLVATNMKHGRYCKIPLVKLFANLQEQFERDREQVQALLPLIMEKHPELASALKEAID